MPGKNTPVQTSAQNPTPITQDEAIRLAVDVVNITNLGMSCMHEMRAILRAIYRLSGADEAIHDLAYVGVSLADDRHNLFDCEAADAKEKLVALKGGRHA